jgi:hypothetical protein
MNPKTRILKIEAIGDFAYHQITPRIRLSGQWLEKAGFKPGHRVEISSLRPGELSLQFREQGPLGNENRDQNHTVIGGQI